MINLFATNKTSSCDTLLDSKLKQLTQKKSFHSIVFGHIEIISGHDSDIPKKIPVNPSYNNLYKHRELDLDIPGKCLDSFGFRFKD